MTQSQGKSVDDMHIIIFEGYLLTVTDVVTYQNNMKRLHGGWMDQMGDMNDGAHEDIMKKSNAKYDLLVSRRKCGERSPNQENCGPSCNPNQATLEKA